MRTASVIALCLLLGCGERAIRMDVQPRDFTAQSYKKVYEAWTREEKDFSWGELKDVLNVTATFESWEFRWAFVVRYANDYKLSPEARSDMLKVSLAEAEQEHRFFVTLSGDRRVESNLTGKRSGWRVALVAPDGREVLPQSIERIRRPTAVDRLYFFSVTPLRDTFRISFPVTDDAGKPILDAAARFVLLRFSGPNGQVDLKWAFAKPG